MSERGDNKDERNSSATPERQWKDTIAEGGGFIQKSRVDHRQCQ